MANTFETGGNTYVVADVEGLHKAPCGNVFESLTKAITHGRRCRSCLLRPTSGPSNKRSRPEPEVESRAAQLVSPNVNVVAESAKCGFLAGEEFDFTVTGVTATAPGDFQVSGTITLKETWPALVDPETHVEWHIAEKELPGFLDSWSRPGLQQKWALLLVDVILYNSNPPRTVQGRVVETYDREWERDHFAERTDVRAFPSTLTGDHRYQNIRVCWRPLNFNGLAIVLATNEMNALCTEMVLNDGIISPRIEFGATAGATFFEPKDKTRIFLSRASMEAAKAHEGIRLSETYLPSLDQLRSVFTQFDHESAYFSARAGIAGRLPSTIFTLPDFKLFEVIASAVIKNSDSAVLERKTVEQVDCGARTKLRKSVKSLLKHFKKEGKSELTILGDEKLAKELAKVASNLHDVVGARSRKLLKKGSTSSLAKE